MREGEIYVNATTISGALGEGSPIMGPYSTMGIPVGAGVSVEGQKGWLIKGKEQKTLSIRGRRCLECGYVELYVKEK